MQLNKSQIVKLPFSYLIYGQFASGGLTTLPLYPTSFPRVLEVADAFEQYRVTRLRYRLHPISVANQRAIAVAYYPGITDNPPAAVTDIAENTLRAVLGVAATVPTKWVSVPTSVLQGCFPWYKTVPGSSDSSEEIVGNLYARGAGLSDYYGLEVEGMFEFKGPANTGATPMARVQAARQRQRERLLSLLSTPGSPSDTRAVTSAQLQKPG